MTRQAIAFLVGSAIAFMFTLHLVDKSESALAVQFTVFHRSTDLSMH
jgi:hypothetical protein